MGGGAGGFDAFEFGDLVDQFGVGGVAVDVLELVDEAGEVAGGQDRLAGRGVVRLFQHVFDYMPLNWK